MMRYKRARTGAEVANEIGAAVAGTDEDRRTAEQADRIEWLKMRGLLIEQWGLDEIDADLRWCGVSGSPTKVHRIQSIVLTKEGYKEVEPTEEGIRRLVKELIVDHALG